MNIYKCIKVIIGLFLLNLIKADEIEYFWSGAVTPESAVISFATDKKAKIKIPDGTQDGKQFRLKGKGMPFMRRGDYGDLYVQIKTEVPVYLNKEQKELLQKFRQIENEKSNPSIKKFFDKAKNFWRKS